MKFQSRILNIVMYVAYVKDQLAKLEFSANFSSKHVLRNQLLADEILESSYTEVQTRD